MIENAYSSSIRFILLCWFYLGRIHSRHNFLFVVLLFNEKLLENSIDKITCYIEWVSICSIIIIFYIIIISDSFYSINHIWKYARCSRVITTSWSLWDDRIRTISFVFEGLPDKNYTIGLWAKVVFFVFQFEFLACQHAQSAVASIAEALVELCYLALVLN